MIKVQIPQSPTEVDETRVVTEQLAKDSLERRFSLESWRKRAIAKGMAADDTGKLLLANLIMKRARRLQLPHGGKKTTR
jgi:predicted transcriptional regulator